MYGRGGAQQWRKYVRGNFGLRGLGQTVGQICIAQDADNNCTAWGDDPGTIVDTTPPTQASGPTLPAGSS